MKSLYVFTIKFHVSDTNILLQSRADTCMLRYNRSTVLKLYATSRHIQPPGTLIFSTDDLLLRLNETDGMRPSQTQSVLSPLKHPKLFKKKMRENYAENGKEPPLLAPNQQIMQDDNKIDFKNRIESQQALNGRNKKLFQDGSASPEFQIPNNYESFEKNEKLSVNNMNQNRYEEEKLSKMNQLKPASGDEYENFYDEMTIRRNHFPGRYPNNRGIRSRLVNSGNEVDFVRCSPNSLH